MNKSYVGIGHNVCPVCGAEHGEVLLIDRRMEDTLEQGMFTGFLLCPEHKAKFDEGYVALVAVNGEPPKGPLLDQYNWSTKTRTGEIVHIRREAFKQLFNIRIPDTLPMTWVEPEVVQRLKKMTNEVGGV